MYTSNLALQQLIDCSFSIFKKKIPSSTELKIENVRVWLYKNNFTPMPKKITVKQLKFFSKLLSFFVSYKNNSCGFNFDKDLQLYDISEWISEIPLFEERISQESPVQLLKKFLKFYTLNFSDAFTVSFFSLLRNGDGLTKENLEYYLQNYRKLITKNMRLFKILMKKEVVYVTNNIFGDRIIYLNVPIRKTVRNMKVFKGNSYLIPLDRVNVFDLSVIYYLSSSFKIHQNAAIGKLSRKKIQDTVNSGVADSFFSVLNKLNFGLL